MKQDFLEQNRDLIVNINGSLVHRDQAAISPFDSVVQNGDAVWEGLRLYSGRIFRLTEHLDRLRDSARALAYADIPPHGYIIEQLKRTLAANHMTDGVHIRLTLTRGVKYTSGMDPRVNLPGCTLIILPEHKPPVYKKTGLTLITAATRRIPPECLDQKIHSCNMLNSILAKIEANLAGADDALMLDIRGCVAETNATHVFIVRHGVVITPAAGSCPEGITRATVIDLCRRHAVPYEVRDMSLYEVHTADEMFCTGTMGELAPVTQVDGRVIGNGQVGPLTIRLSDLYADLTRTEGVMVARAG
jgi:branched-chain amino acid aminotransferase